MNRFGNEYNPYGRNRSRFESQEDFAKRCEEDKKSVEEAERRRREEEKWEHD